MSSFLTSLFSFSPCAGSGAYSASTALCMRPSVAIPQQQEANQHAPTMVLDVSGDSYSARNVVVAGTSTTKHRWPCPTQQVGEHAVGETTAHESRRAGWQPPLRTTHLLVHVKVERVCRAAARETQRQREEHAPRSGSPHRGNNAAFSTKNAIFAILYLK